MSIATITAALNRARRRQDTERAQQLRTVLRAQALRQPPVLQDAYAAVVASGFATIATLNRQIDRLGAVESQHFGRHRDGEIYASLPGLGAILAARILGEFGDAPDRYPDAKARQNYAGTSPITRASGTKKVVGPLRPQPTPRRSHARGHVAMATDVTRPQFGRCALRYRRHCASPINSAE